VSVSLVYETHATTTDNENGIATGWRPGELSAVGRENARSLGRRRRDDGIDVVICSDLTRAVETVRIAFDGSDVPVETDVRLREVDYGELGGAPVGIVHARRRVDVPFPAGQSYREVCDGVADLLDQLVLERDGRRVLLVGHAATRFALDHLLTGRPLETAVVAPFAWREGWEWQLEASRPVLEVVDGAGALARSDELRAIYLAAFGAPGYDETAADADRFATETLPTHAARHGFRAVVLRVADETRAFAYGYTGKRGQWWSDQIASRVSPEVVDTWVGGHFELVEVAVGPAYQGHGYAAALHDALLLGLPHDRALLTTYGDERPAPRLYRRLGWTRLAGAALPDRDLYGLDLRDWRSRPRSTLS
jgi:broad specificity phosphatase PhoE/ribosomal protein S18 acetylase RimI-like enzyme